MNHYSLRAFVAGYVALDPDYAESKGATLRKLYWEGFDLLHYMKFPLEHTTSADEHLGEIIAKYCGLTEPPTMKRTARLAEFLGGLYANT